MAKVSAQRVGSTSHVWGYVIVIIAAFSFISFMYVVLISKLLSLLSRYITDAAQKVTNLDFNSGLENENLSLLLAVEKDVYYCYLIPLTVPVTIVACYANWVSLKFFRHN